MKAVASTRIFVEFSYLRGLGSSYRLVRDKMPAVLATAFGGSIRPDDVYMFGREHQDPSANMPPILVSIRADETLIHAPSHSKSVLDDITKEVNELSLGMLPGSDESVRTGVILNLGILYYEEQKQESKG